MNRKFALAALACTALSSPAFAQESAPADTAEGEDAIVVTAARTILPPGALPLTIDIIDKDTLDQQIAISGSVTDAVATLTPSFSPTRQKLSGAGETLRGRAPLYAINGIPQSTPMRGQPRRLHHRRLLRRPGRGNLRIERVAGDRRHGRHRQPGHRRRPDRRRRVGPRAAPGDRRQ